MKTLSALSIIAAMCLTLSVSQTAQAVQGINVVPVPAQSDVLVSVPFNQDSEGDFTVASVTAGGVTVTGALVAGDYNNGLFYARFTTGAAAGLWTTISANTASELTLVNADVKALVAPGDELTIYPHQTIGTVMQDRLRNISFTAGTQVLLYDNAAAAQNKSTTTTVTFITFPVTTWSGGNGVNTILPPESMFVVRNPGGTTLNFVTYGDVPTHPVSHLIPASATKDILIGTGYPVPTTVGKTNFEGVANRQILTFDNTDGNSNKSSTGTVTYITFPVQVWSGLSGDQTALPPAEGFIFRQNGGAGGVITATSPY